MTIRPATKADISPLAELFRQQAEYQQRLAHSFELLADADFDEFVSQRIGREHAQILVDERDGSLVGYISVRVVTEGAVPTVNDLRAWLKRIVHRRKPKSVFQPRRFGFVEDWYVVPKHQHQGIGIRLWTASLQWFKRKKVKEIDAFVWANNHSTQTLFGKLGFTTVQLRVRKELH
jgi:ribosomal protein S18 acetylase RimI-like enzyme